MAFQCKYFLCNVDIGISFSSILVFPMNAILVQYNQFGFLLGCTLYDKKSPNTFNFRRFVDNLEKYLTISSRNSGV